MKTIWKYPLKICELQTIHVPGLSSLDSIWGQVLHVGQQNNIPTLWVMLDTEMPTRNIEVRIIGTGQGCPDTDDSMYIGTSICNPFVWHIFARVIE